MDQTTPTTKPNESLAPASTLVEASADKPGVEPASPAQPSVAPPPNPVAEPPAGSSPRPAETTAQLQSQPAAATSDAKQRKTPEELAQLEAAHARAHKRLTIIELIGTALLIFLALTSLAVWAYYHKTTSPQSYSTNEYQ